jgi:hypothetical protein
MNVILILEGMRIKIIKQTNMKVVQGVILHKKILLLSLALPTKMKF